MQKRLYCNPAACSYENGKYVGSIIGDSNVTKSVPTKVVLTKCTSTNFYILPAFLLITIALLVAVSIYHYLIKHQEKQKSLLPWHYTISKLKKTRY